MMPAQMKVKSPTWARCSMPFVRLVDPLRDSYFAGMAGRVSRIPVRVMAITGNTAVLDAGMCCQIAREVGLVVKPQPKVAVQHK